MREEKTSRLGMMDRVYGAIAVAAVVLAVWYLVKGARPADGGADGAAPALVIESPAAGTTVSQPLSVVFAAGPGLDANGSDPVRQRHVHADVGGVMVMPEPGSVQPLGGGRYRWRLQPQAPGEKVLRLYWSDAMHRPLRGAPADSVQLRLR